MKVMYNVSFLDKNGLRCLLGPNQGHRMYENRESAEGFLRALLENTGEDRLVDVCGPQSRGTFQVAAFRCYDHGDAVGCYAVVEDV